jgi:hypothetical protein
MGEDPLSEGEDAAAVLIRAAAVIRRAIMLLDAGDPLRARRGLERLAAWLGEQAEELEADQQEADLAFLDDLAVLRDLGYPLDEIITPVEPAELVAVEL